MTTIYLIRHAEAEGNLYRRAHGQYDALITENGYRQIRALAKRFENISVDVVWSSDLFRTMTTARAILEPQELPLNTHQGLREINMGIWEDKTWGQLIHDYREGMVEFAESSQTWHPEHGETFEKLTERMGKTVTELARQHEGKTIAIFSHGLAIRQFMAYVNGVPPEQWGNSPHGDNTSVSKLYWDGTTFSVEMSADNSHLDDNISTLARQKWWKKENGVAVKERSLWFRLLDNHEDELAYQSAMLELWGVDSPNPSGRRTVYVAMEEETHVGWVSLDDEGQLMMLHLLEGARGDRLGIQMLGQGISHARSKGAKFLSFACPSVCNCGFFLKHGFVERDGRYELYIGNQPRSDILQEE